MKTNPRRAARIARMALIKKVADLVKAYKKALKSGDAKLIRSSQKAVESLGNKHSIRYSLT